MTPYTVYLLSTGQILRSGYCLAAQLAAQVRDSASQGVLPAESRPRTQRVDITATPPVVVDL